MSAKGDYTSPDLPSLARPRSGGEGLRSQHVANLLWSYGTLEAPAPRLTAGLLRVLAERPAEFTCQVGHKGSAAAALLPACKGSACTHSGAALAQRE